MSTIETETLAIYAGMATDWSDVLELINECEDRKLLQTLKTMLTLRKAREVKEINRLFVDAIERRLVDLTTPEIVEVTTEVSSSDLVEL